MSLKRPEEEEPGLVYDPFLSENAFLCAARAVADVLLAVEEDIYEKRIGAQLPDYAVESSLLNCAETIKLLVKSYDGKADDLFLAPSSDELPPPPIDAWSKDKVPVRHPPCNTILEIHGDSPRSFIQSPGGFLETDSYRAVLDSLSALDKAFEATQAPTQAPERSYVPRKASVGVPLDTKIVLPTPQQLRSSSNIVFEDSLHEDDIDRIRKDTERRHALKYAQAKRSEKVPPVDQGQGEGEATGPRVVFEFGNFLPTQEVNIEKLPRFMNPAPRAKHRDELLIEK